VRADEKLTAFTELQSRRTSPLFEIARVLVRLFTKHFVVAMWRAKAAESAA
jgi:hypothetical protein